MLTLESLASCLASDPDFRTEFASDPQVFQSVLGNTEGLVLKSLRSLLGLAPDCLVSALLSNPESEVEGPPDWGVPPPLLRSPYL